MNKRFKVVMELGGSVTFLIDAPTEKEAIELANYRFAMDGFEAEDIIDDFIQSHASKVVDSHEINNEPADIPEI